MMENRTRDNSLFMKIMLCSVRRDMGEPEEDGLGDETWPPLVDSQASAIVF